MRSARWRALGKEEWVLEGCGVGDGGRERLLDHGEVAAVGLKQLLLLVLA